MSGDDAIDPATTRHCARQPEAGYQHGPAGSFGNAAWRAARLDLRAKVDGIAKIAAIELNRRCAGDAVEAEAAIGPGTATPEKRRAPVFAYEGELANRLQSRDAPETAKALIEPGAS